MIRLGGSPKPSEPSAARTRSRDFGDRLVLGKPTAVKAAGALPAGFRRRLGVRDRLDYYAAL